MPGGPGRAFSQAMLALGYYRLREPGVPVERLQETFSEYCDLYLHQPIDMFVDVGDGPPYPEYARMVKYMEDSPSDFLIVVPGAEHLGTDLESVARSVLELEGVGAKVSCADEDLPDPLQNALATIGVENVSRDRSDRIRDSMRRLAIEGRTLGRPPYGYRSGPDGVLEVHPEEAEVVRLAYRLYTDDCRGLRLIAGDLNERGLTTRRGGRWNVATLRDMLRNPAYVGTYTRFGLRVPKSHKAIVAPETFRAAQDVFRARRRRVSAPASEPFLLSGIAYCAECGNKMIGVTRRQTWRRKDRSRHNRIYRYYQCQSRNNLSICRYHTWRAEALEERTLRMLEELLSGEAPEDADRRRAEREGRLREASGQRLTNARRRFLRALRKVATGEAPTRDLTVHLDELEALRRAVDPDPDSPPANARLTLGKWESLDISDRQDFLRLQIDRIVVGDDAVELVA